MYLVIVVLALLAYGTYGIAQLLKPPAPSIEDLDKHLKYLSSLPDQNARRKYLKNRKAGDKKCLF